MSTHLSQTFTLQCDPNLLTMSFLTKALGGLKKREYWEWGSSNGCWNTDTNSTNNIPSIGQTKRFIQMQHRHRHKPVTEQPPKELQLLLMWYKQLLGLTHCLLLIGYVFWLHKSRSYIWFVVCLLRHTPCVYRSIQPVSTVVACAYCTQTASVSFVPIEGVTSGL